MRLLLCFIGIVFLSPIAGFTEEDPRKGESKTFSSLSVLEALPFENTEGTELDIPLPKDILDKNFVYSLFDADVDVSEVHRVYRHFVESDPVITAWNRKKGPRSSSILKYRNEQKNESGLFVIRKDGQLFRRIYRKSKAVKANSAIEKSALNLGTDFHKALVTSEASRLRLFSNEALHIANTMRIPKSLPFSVRYEDKDKKLVLKLLEVVDPKAELSLVIVLEDPPGKKGKGSVANLSSKAKRVGIRIPLFAVKKATPKPRPPSPEAGKAPTLTPPATPVTTPTVTPTVIPTVIPTATPTALPTEPPPVSATPSATPAQPTPSPTPTQRPEPSSTPTIPAPTSTPTSTPTPTPTPTATPTPPPPASTTPTPTPPLSPIVGSCGSDLNSCTSGTVKDIADTETFLLWNCIGTNGGQTASCKKAITNISLPPSTEVPAEPSSYSRTYVVELTGNDSNPGTAAQPFRTILKALQVANPGERVVVGAGNFAEVVSSVKNGEPGKYIVIDGQKKATIKQFSFKHSYIRLQNFTVVGYNTTYSRLVGFRTGAHHNILFGNVLDGQLFPKMAGISWDAGPIKPFDPTTSSDNIVANNTVKNVLASTLISIMGDRNLVQGNQFIDSGQADFVRLWGRANRISGNYFANNYSVAGQGNHPDFIQTFGNNGHGSRDHIIESNIVDGIEGGQLTQLEANLVPDIQNWIFRNNIFMNVALQASCTVPNIQYYNNIFYRCNQGNGGHALNFGSRSYEERSVHSSAPGYALLLSPVPSGSLEKGEYYTVKTPAVASGGIQTGVEYRVISSERSATVTYNGTTYGDKQTFVGTSTKTFTASGSASVRENGFVHYEGTDYPSGASFYAAETKTFSKSTPGTEVWRKLFSRAHGAKVFNNVFLESGTQTVNTKGWYGISNELNDVGADYNYVAKEAFAPMREDTLKRSVGSIGGWDAQRWYEPSGINGGNPGFTNLGAKNFTLLSSSILRDKAKALPQVLTDFIGIARPQGAAPDIGAYEYKAP